MYIYIHTHALCECGGGCTKLNCTKTKAHGGEGVVDGMIKRNHVIQVHVWSLRCVYSQSFGFKTEASSFCVFVTEEKKKGAQSGLLVFWGALKTRRTKRRNELDFISASHHGLEERIQRNDTSIGEANHDKWRLLSQHVRIVFQRKALNLDWFHVLGSKWLKDAEKSPQICPSCSRETDAMVSSGQTPECLLNQRSTLENALPLQDETVNHRGGLDPPALVCIRNTEIQEYWRPQGSDKSLSFSAVDRRYQL